MNRINNAGSLRWIRRNAALGADAVRKKPLTPEAIEQRRERAKQLNVGQYLTPGYKGLCWTPAELAMLGTMTDVELVARIGKTVNACGIKRQRLGIKPVRDRRRSKHRK